MNVGVRTARPDDHLAVRRVLDAALLEVGDVATAIDRGEVLVAVEAGRECRATETERVLGALVLDGDRVEAVAVRRRRRGRGIGTALVEAASERRGRLTADFRAEVRPFYETLGFAVEERDGRLWGVRGEDEAGESEREA
ncbi:GNAT family N-acetyltransferase [Halomarina pelagica]|uniref:GNAT family N-acetyltransferase n=1 Tax=Halomarina pelagica TaxID=2961599 RepID=UPI0034A1C804